MKIHWRNSEGDRAGGEDGLEQPKKHPLPRDTPILSALRFFEMFLSENCCGKSRLKGLRHTEYNGVHGSIVGMPFCGIPSPGSPV